MELSVQQGVMMMNRAAKARIMTIKPDVGLRAVMYTWSSFVSVAKKQKARLRASVDEYSHCVLISSPSGLNLRLQRQAKCSDPLFERTVSVSEFVCQL